MPPKMTKLAAGIRRLADDSFPDLAFLDPSGILNLTRRIKAVTVVRVELPATDFLNLSCVLVDTPDVSDLVADTTLAASSQRPGTEAVPDPARLFDPENRGVAVHTNKEHGPWLEIKFRRPVDVSRIFLRNRTGDASLRARGIQVLTRTSDGCWHTVYDGVRRQREFIGAAEKLHSRSLPERMAIAAVMRLTRGRVAPSTRSNEADLMKVLTRVQLREYQSIVRALGQTRLSAEDCGEFRRVVNDEVLAARELEWTSHGARRSFRFWPQEEQSEYVRFAMDIVEDLRELNEYVCFGFGSVLSVVRDQALIPHDDDLDILIGFEQQQAQSLDSAIELVRECLRQKGYAVTGNHVAHQWVKHPDGRSKHKVDVFVGLFEGDTVSWYPGKRGVLTRDMMFPPRYESLLGHKCAVPREAEEYLQQTYGPSWSVPDPNFRHNWEKKAYADIK